ncbi:protein kinase [Thiohalocapsa sp. ML1]|jgi:serine/threonine protein kinase|uniref:methylation-associated defense system protein kinase MAD6 n=1 Tax=Thiohalocapsa sp. ML1 TaxID=1431688 RepID=UPI0007322C9C|nr:protein kinase [Thiohalocapsa sp. ML1]
MPAKVISVGEPVNESERLAIAHLRDRLPTGYAVIHNFEILHNETRYEVDLAVVAPHALYLVDVKGTRGRIEVDGSYWCPQGRQCFKSPLLKLRGHAKALKGLIVDSDPARHAELGRIFVGSAVILTAPDAAFDDRTERDADEVVRLEQAVAFFTDPERVPSRFDRAVGKLISAISKALKIAVRKPKGPARYGNWEVVERISGGEGYTEYRAANPFAGARAGTVRLRVYRADPYQDAPSREAERRLIGNAYRALSRLPPHASIVGARDFFPLEDESGYVLVTDDVPGSALRLHLERPALALTLDQKLRIAEELLSALAHAHAHGVVHRNICPATVLLGQDGHTRLLGFDYARAVPGGSQTVAEQVAGELDRDYQAPELHVGPSAATGASDVFSAGLVLYELFAGERPFDDFTAMFALNAVFPQGAGDLAPGLPEGLGAWLQSLCTFQIDARPSAAEALAAFRPIVTGQEQTGSRRAEGEDMPGAEGSLDYLTLKPGTRLGQKFVVMEQLGRPGAFGVVYKVVDTFGDVTRVLKLILRDRESTLNRLKKEYQTLLRVPEHPNVVKVVDADVLPGDRTPYLVFEYVDGLDVADMVRSGPMDPEDALALGRQVAAGLDHLHRHNVYHCDIKPGNLLWTDAGVRIIDFNVAVHTQRDEGLGGGTRRYVPPDFDAGADATPETLADRDLYALGVTLFEILTGRPPWDGAPSLSALAPDPRGAPDGDGLDGALAELVQRLISPRRAERPASAAEVLDALQAIPRARRVVLPAVSDLTGHRIEGFAPPGSGRPGTPGNPFVDYLLTLYSQSRTSNAGTRGLDALGKKLYVETALDEDLVEAVLAGGLRLVVVTGNAGDGKTAFLQVLEQRARKRGAAMDPPRVNGCRFTLDGRVYLSNYDGSQDEGERSSDSVLLDFLGPFAGPLQDDGTLPAAAAPGTETRLIAINEGRLIDFLETRGDDFAGLAQVVRRGLATGARQDGIAVVNLNLRSIVALPRAGSGSHKSLLRRMIERLVDLDLWTACENCELAPRCYVRHNVRTFQDSTAGEKVVERLETLYALTHLRGRLHITLRDLRSALAFMLVGTRNCAEIHALYAAGDAQAVLQGFYFNSWMGGDGENRDRLLTLLKQVDMGRVPDPRLDRGLDFVSPGEEPALHRFAERGGYDLELLKGLFERLPRGYQGNAERAAMARHRQYLAMARRRQFFERRDPAVAAMLPYRAGMRMLGIIRGEVSTETVLPELIDAINRGEGLADTGRLGGAFALQVRRVDKGTIKSFRLFPRERFSLDVSDEARDAEFIEHMPSRLVLRYRAEHGADPRLPINLDIFEMLQRLNQGYRPGVEESQGFYMGLEVFKNLLGSAPYQEVLLTTSGHDFYRIRREPTGRLVMDQPALETE